MKISSIKFSIIIFFALLQPVYAQNDFQSAHFNLLKIRLNARLNPENLAFAIKEIAKSDQEKAMYLFLWISENISYDAESFFNGKVPDSSPQAVLDKRVAFCEGYSNLYENVGKKLGLEIKTIRGYSKGYGYAQDHKLPKEPNHSWNAVKINDKWFLVDVTWGAGYLDNHKFIRKPEPFYFMTAPEDFIFDHFPNDPGLQYLEKPLTLDEFKRLPYLRPGFFSSGLALDSHRNYQIFASKDFEIFLKSTAETLVTARLLKGDFEYLSSVFVQKENLRYHIYVSVPETGTYTLRIFAKKKNSISRGYPWAMDYQIESSYRSSNTYPVSFGHNEIGLRLISPLEGALKAGVETIFEIEIPDAESVAIKNGSVWKILEKTGTHYMLKVKLEKGKALLLVRFKNENSYIGALEYFVE